MDNIKNIIANNIAELRQSKGITQLELAEYLNYSDKAVSKWERGESVPDISVLVKIAEYFEVNLDYLIKEQHTLKDTADTYNKTVYNRGIITSVSILLVWFIAVFAFVVVVLSTNKVGYSWLSFIFAIPVSAIVWLVLNSIWFNKKSNYFIISILMWSVLLSIHIALLTAEINVGLLYLLGVPGQLIIFLWSLIKKRHK